MDIYSTYIFSYRRFKSGRRGSTMVNYSENGGSNRINYQNDVRNVC